MRRGRGTARAYSLWTRRRLSWRWIMTTWQRWHIGFIHYFAHIFKLYQNIQFSLIWTQFNPPLTYEDFVTYILDEPPLFVRGSTMWTDSACRYLTHALCLGEEAARRGTHVQRISARGFSSYSLADSVSYGPIRLCCCCPTMGYCPTRRSWAGWVSDERWLCFAFTSHCIGTVGLDRVQFKIVSLGQSC